MAKQAVDCHGSVFLQAGLQIAALSPLTRQLFAIGRIHPSVGSILLFLIFILSMGSNFLELAVELVVGEFICPYFLFLLKVV